MAKTSACSIGVTVTGDGITLTYAPPQSPVENTAAPQGGPVLLALSSGFNTVSVPTGAIGCLLVPATGSAITKTLKGLTGDTGVPIRTDGPTLLWLPNSTASFGLTTSGTENVQIFWL